jgi:hypothetical protein
LQVSLAAGFNPDAGDAFDVITANSSSGVFSSIVLPALDDGLLWKVDATSGLSLSVLFSADFDVDGNVDDYTDDGAGSVDDAFVDPAWEIFILGSSSHPIVGFDSLTTNQNVAFTAQHVIDPGERVINATLALAIKQSGGDLGTDFVRVIDTDPSHRLQFSTLGWDTQVNTSDSFVGVFDMGAFLDDLQTGSVNVQVNDDSGVDWALYTATVATPIADPTGPTVFIDSGTANVDASVGPVAELNLGTAGSATLDLAAAGLIDVNGDFTMGASANLAVELAAAQYGTLEVQDAATLAGGLQVSLAAGFNPDAGDAFDVITANSSSGIFSSIVLPALDDGLLWKVDANSGLSLSVLFSADFDEDGEVEDNDLNNWQAGFGNLSALHMDGDADGNGLVNGSDFFIWQRQFGLSVSISSVAEIPEPTAGFLALSSVLFMLLFLKIRAT